ncbi:hypothetical protein AB0O39_37780 [Streptomyces anulatus]|uniref:hypothetical protein n=1 Tax=Streptomyces anulatus TaxID=1892 RepID=UPI003428037E
MSSQLRTAGLVAAVLLAAGCAADDQDVTGTEQGPPPALYETARTYQEAAARGDWHTACAATSTRKQGGSLARCLDSHPAPGPGATADSSPPADPPRYADGSTPVPRERRTTGGPDRADTGPVSATGAQPVAASGDHPAGYAVLVAYSVQWPGKAATSTRRALRLVQEGGQWRVDQLADLHPGETSLLAALGGRP